MTPQILFEDGHLMVIAKPAGIVVNRAESVKEPTVQDWVEKSVILGSIATPESGIDAGQASTTYNTDFAKRNGIVHRIDKETSGCLIIAKTPEAFVELQRQFKDREVEKTYVALCHGFFEPNSGIVKIPVGRLPWNRERFGLLVGGRDSESLYKVQNEYTRDIDKDKENYSLVEWYPKTGRTHQIRIHAKHLGHPVVSDSFYAGRKTARKDRMWCSRLFLHAAGIKFTHPVTGKKISVESVLPKDLSSTLKLLTPSTQ